MRAVKVLHLHGPEAGNSSPEALIEDYLDHLCAPLIGIVPYERRIRLRDEARFNIQGRMEMYVRDGVEPAEAAAQAVEKYGHTDELSEQFLEEWMHYLPKGSIARRLGLPMSYAAFAFFESTFIGMLILQVRMYAADPRPYTFGLPNSTFRQIFPEPLPLPEASPSWVLLWSYAFLAPLIAGWFTGTKALTGAARAACMIMMPLVIGSFMLGTLMLPTTEGLWFAFVQILWWVPAGALTAHVASVLARRRRLRFRPTTRK